SVHVPDEVRPKCFILRNLKCRQVFVAWIVNAVADVAVQALVPPINVEFRPATVGANRPERSRVHVLQAAASVGAKGLPDIEFTLHTEPVGDVAPKVGAQAPNVGHLANGACHGAQLPYDPGDADFKGPLGLQAL